MAVKPALHLQPANLPFVTSTVSAVSLGPLSPILLTLAVIGHVVIVRALINQLYELGLPQRVWNLAFIVLAAVAVAGSVFIVRSWEENGARALLGGTWTDIHPAWAAYLAACLIAPAIGVIVLALRLRSERVPAQLATRSEVLDGCVALQRVPASDHTLGRVARRLPGNEIFSVEFVHRELRLPRLPAAFDGTSIIHLTDLHMSGTPDRSFFEWACQRCLEKRPDLVVMTDDVIDHLGVLDWLPATLGRFPEATPLGCWFVLGNHDLHVAADPIREAMRRIGWTCVAGQTITRSWRGGTVLLAGTERPWAGSDPPLADAPPASLKLLLSHAPHRVHWARRHAIDLMFAGHLHGGQVRWPLIGPASGGRFHGGLYDLPPTLLHVSRGLGQMTPLRWRCPPEATTLVLRARG